MLSVKLHSFKTQVNEGIYLKLTTLTKSLKITIYLL